MTDDLLTVPEVAERLRVSPMTIYRWIDDGKLPAMQVARRYRIRAIDVEQMMGSSQIAARDDPWGADPPSAPSVAE
jgi:excisionase family DNA binding protein